jgi:hypothetical protein
VALARAGELHRGRAHRRRASRNFACGTFAHPQAERHIVGGAHVREKRVVLEHDADVAPERRQIDDRPSLQVDLARGRRKKSGDEAERRSLAAAGGSEQRHEFAFAHIEIDAGDRHCRSVALLDPHETQRRFSHAGDLRR